MIDIFNETLKDVQHVRYNPETPIDSLRAMRKLVEGNRNVSFSTDYSVDVSKFDCYKILGRKKILTIYIEGYNHVMG